MAVQPARSRLAQLVNQPPLPVLLVQLAITSQLAQTLLRKLRHILTLTTLATLPI